MSNAPNSNQAENSKAIALMVDGQRRDVSFNDAFSFGHQLWRRGKVLESTLVFQRLQRLDSTCRPARFMLARGLARLGKFADCHQLLHETLGAEDSSLASKLHDAFVMRAVGHKRDAIRELAEIAKGHDDLPSICLILGDLWESLGDSRCAQAAWKLAAQRARGRGPVAHSAAFQMASTPQPTARHEQDSSG